MVSFLLEPEGKTFEDLAIPSESPQRTSIPEKEWCFTRGLIVEPIRASLRHPGMSPPVQIAVGTWSDGTLLYPSAHAPAP